MPYTQCQRLFDMALENRPLSASDGLFILQARGPVLSQLLAGAHRLREQSFGDTIELCSIINAKSGRCPENCAFCAQSAHHQTDAPVFPLRSEEDMVAGALEADAAGSHCYGIVTSGTRIDGVEEFKTITAALTRIGHETGLDPSASLGILDRDRAEALAAAGCVTYHHNLETAESFFPQICTTHAYSEDIATVRVAKAAGMKVCCGGILGLGESLEQRYELAATLRELTVDSVPLNFLNPVAGTRLQEKRELSPLDCVRAIALFRYMLPKTKIAVCGGREPNLRDFQSWMFMAGASGTMVGNYLTTSGRKQEDDLQMFMDAEVTIGCCS